MNSVVSEKGQVTIPKRLRRQLGLSAGTILEFSEVQGKLVAEKKIEGNPLDGWVGRGKLPFGASSAAYLKQIRRR